MSFQDLTPNISLQTRWHSKMKSLLHDKPHFYKYCTSETVKKIINTRSTKWSSPVIFNDPFDFQTEFRFGFEIEELKQKLSDEIENLVFGDEEPKGDLDHPLFAMTMLSRKNRNKSSKEAFRKFMQPAADEGEKNALKYLTEIQAWWKEFRLKFRVYCVSEVHNDILMWAHYADCHRGAVIKHKCLTEFDRAICAALPVKYEAEIPVIANIDEYVLHLTGQRNLDLTELFTMFATTKSPHWSYEKEWRCISYDSLNDGSLFEFSSILPEEIEAIYLGCKMNKEDQLEIQKLISGDFSHVKLWKAHKHLRRYELSFTRLN